MDDSPAAVGKEAQVSRQMAELSEAIDHSGKLQNDLTEKLSLITRVDSQVEAEVDKKDEQELVPHAHEIRLLSNRIRRMNETYAGLIERLEI